MTKREMEDRADLGAELDRLLGADKFKSLGEELALVIAKHGLSKSPDVCEKVFAYMSLVIRSWNSV